VNVIRTDVERGERYCNEHVYTVNKRVSISEKTGDLNHRPEQLRSEIMNHTLPRHRRKNNKRKGNMVAATQNLRGSKNASEDRGVSRTDTPTTV